MRVILAGQRAFGAATYRMLRDVGHDVAAVQAPRNPGPLLGPDTDPLLRLALEDEPPAAPLVLTAGRGLSRHQVRVIAEYRGPVDLIVAAHSHDFVSRPARLATRLGAIGYHPSLLPRHRGRSAVEWTIRDRDPVTGGTVYWLDDRMDAGDIASQDWCWVRPDDDARTLWRRELFPLGLRLLAHTLAALDAGHETRAPQDEALATFEPAMTPPRVARPDLPELPAPGANHRRRIERGRGAGLSISVTPNVEHRHGCPHGYPTPYACPACAGAGAAVQRVRA
jgi:methionyl-tRNA formyltransferase